MLICQRTAFSLAEQTHDRMPAFGTFQLTHPELLSETQLRDILKNSCIDFSNYENLSKSELIEMYKRVAMPLPQRQSENAQDTCTEDYSEEKYSTSETQKSSNTLNSNPHSLKRNFNDATKVSHPSNARRPKSPVNEHKETAKKICLNNCKGGTERNAIGKHTHDGRQDESPLKKRQKITWP